MFLSTFPLALVFSLFSLVSAQSTTPYTDPNTSITYQSTTQNLYTFDLALPSTSTGSFIGRISCKAATGWAAVSLGGAMSNSLMVVIWPNGEDIVASLRVSSGYETPATYSGSAALRTIASGTSFDGTTYTYTFLCEGCILADGSTFTANDSEAILGWAVGSAAVSNPADATSELEFHDTGNGMFSVDMTAAKSASFETWVTLADAGAVEVPTTPSTTVPTLDDTDTPQTTGKPTTGQPTTGQPTTGQPTTGQPTTGNNTTISNNTIPATVSNFTYDYIVVGGGPSGLITSQRLTETGASVLLVERGLASTASTGGKQAVPWNTSLTYYDVPGLFYPLPSATEAEGYCTDTASIAGCILGGGGSVNGMAFIHPPRWDFDDNWPTGWKWVDVEPAAEKLYARNGGTTQPSADGQIHDNESGNIVTAMLKANGWEFADGIESPDAKIKSYGPPQVNIVGGLRSGPIHTYLPLAQAESNFKLQLETKVIRTVRTGSTITGVELESSTGSREIVNLNTGGAVLLAAGVMSTPRVLFNSGIGPTEQVNAVKTGTTSVTLPPETDWINLPVGQEVKDHSRYELTFNVTAGLTAYSVAQLADPSELDKDLFNAGSGVMVQTFQRLDTFRQVNTSDGHTIMFQSHISSVSNDTLQFMLLQTHGLTSRGIMGIDGAGKTKFSKDPWTNTDTDKEAWTIAINEILDMARAPGSGLIFSLGSNASAAAVLQTPVEVGIHMVGSTKMGTDDGRTGGTAVVDLDTKVYGTDNLFVVDASFHPDLPTGNSQAIIMVAAEHAVERIIALRGTGTSTPSVETGYPTTGSGSPTVESSSPSVEAGYPTTETPSTEADTPSEEAGYPTTETPSTEADTPSVEAGYPTTEADDDDCE